MSKSVYPPKRKRIRKYLRTDEREDVVNTLEFVALVAETLGEKPLNWKWIIIGLHNALQGALVCALSGTDGTGALADKSKKKMLQWFEDHRSKPDTLLPGTWLAGLMTLYKKATSPPGMSALGGTPLQTTTQQDKDVALLNNLRREFVHFEPKGWSIESAGLPRIVLNVSAIIEGILCQPSISLSMTQRQTKRALAAIRKLKKVAQG